MVDPENITPTVKTVRISQNVTISQTCARFYEDFLTPKQIFMVVNLGIQIGVKATIFLSVVLIAGGKISNSKTKEIGLNTPSYTGMMLGGASAIAPIIFGSFMMDFPRKKQLFGMYLLQIIGGILIQAMTS